MRAKKQKPVKAWAAMRDGEILMDALYPTKAQASHAIKNACDCKWCVRRVLITIVEG